MHIKKIFEQHKSTFSFEFFPPKTEKGAETLYASIKELSPLKPSFVSVTYGAGGSTRELTHDLVVKIKKETDLTVVCHLTCVGGTQKEIASILETYSKSGIENILALRGDPPSGEENFTVTPGGFATAAELVTFIKKEFPGLGIGVAGFPEGHPGTPNRLQEMDYLKAKVDTGADFICTQLFLDNRDFFDFTERCTLAGIEVPIIAGIMPITSSKNLRRIADFAAGCRFPARLLKSLNRAQNDEGVQNVGIHWATEQVRDLIDCGVKGIHFYTLNKSNATREIYAKLGVSTSQQLNE